MTTVQDLDVVDLLLGSAAAGTAALRAARPEVITHTAGAYLALFEPAEATPGPALSRTERLAVALRVAAVSGAEQAAEHYRASLEPLFAERVVSGRVTDPRLAAILTHADLLTVRPSAATPEHHTSLAAVGLTADEIVTLSQLVAFVSYQIRVVAGLAVIAAASQQEQSGAPRPSKEGIRA